MLRDLIEDIAREVMEDGEGIYQPAHYCDGGIETIDFIRAKLTPEQFNGYCMGNTMKYLSRAGKKGDIVEDLRKAEVYLGWLIESAE